MSLVWYIIWSLLHELVFIYRSSHKSVFKPPLYRVQNGYKSESPVTEFGSSNESETQSPILLLSPVYRAQRVVGGAPVEVAIQGLEKESKAWCVDGGAWRRYFSHGAHVRWWVGGVMGLWWHVGCVVIMEVRKGALSWGWRAWGMGVRGGGYGGGGDGCWSMAELSAAEVARRPRRLTKGAQGCMGEKEE